MMASSTKVTMPAIKWATESYRLTFQLLEILSDYPSFCKGIWPGVGEWVSGANKIKYCQDIASGFFYIMKFMTTMFKTKKRDYRHMVSW